MTMTLFIANGTKRTTWLFSPLQLAGTAPWFLQTLTDNIEVCEGDAIDLKIIVDGEPKPRGACAHTTSPHQRYAYISSARVFMYRCLHLHCT